MVKDARLSSVQPPCRCSARKCLRVLIWTSNLPSSRLTIFYRMRKSHCNSLWLYQQERSWQETNLSGADVRVAARIQGPRQCCLDVSMLRMCTICRDPVKTLPFELIDRRREDGASHSSRPGAPHEKQGLDHQG